MALTCERLKGLDNQFLTADERAVLRCEAASELIEAGQYEAARDALGELWRGVGVRPDVAALGEAAAAEVLLKAGILSGVLGEGGQACDSQAYAKDLISESATLFERAGEMEKAAFARSDLALCYWREGAYDEARILLTEASGELDAADPERRASVLLRRGTVECESGRLYSALGILKETELVLLASENHALRGSFHKIRGMTLRRFGDVDGQGDYYDRAVIEFTAAVYHYERASHERSAASVENDLASLLNRLGRHADAHRRLDRAGAMLARDGDAGCLARADVTRAQVLVAERRYRDASRVIAGPVSALDGGGEAALLAEALTVQGFVWARLGNYEDSINALRRAVSLAEEAGAVSCAGLAALTLIEEHGTRRAISANELHELYLRADLLLEDTQNAEVVARLRACARVVIRRLTGVQLREKNFTLFSAVHEFEAKCIAQALEDSGGSVTHAARLLGIRHQTLTSILETRHKGLSKKRTPVRKRLRSIMKKAT